jgi:hypothetical protein
VLARIVLLGTQPADRIGEGQEIVRARGLFHLMVRSGRGARRCEPREGRKRAMTDEGRAMRGEGTTTGAARHLDRVKSSTLRSTLSRTTVISHLGHQHAAALLEPLVEAALDGGELLRGHLRREAALRLAEEGLHLRRLILELLGPRLAASTWLVIASLVVVIDSKLASSCLRMLSERSACIPG